MCWTTLQQISRCHKVTSNAAVAYEHCEQLKTQYGAMYGMFFMSVKLYIDFQHVENIVSGLLAFIGAV